MRYQLEIVSPRIEWWGEDEPDGYWRQTVGDRLRAARAKARQMGLLWLSPYIPRYSRVQSLTGSWDTSVGGYLRATPARALRLHFGDSDRDPATCGSCRVLTLAAAWKVDDPAVRWADMGDADAWPIQWRVDARRMESRFAALANATWCQECDDAPWGSTTMRCLWCERMGAPPRVWQSPARMAA